MAAAAARGRRWQHGDGVGSVVAASAEAAWQQRGGSKQHGVGICSVMLVAAARWQRCQSGGGSATAAQQWRAARRRRCQSEGGSGSAAAAVTAVLAAQQWQAAGKQGPPLSFVTYTARDRSWNRCIASQCRDRSRSVSEIYRPLALARLYGEFAIIRWSVQRLKLKFDFRCPDIESRHLKSNLGI